MANPKTADSDVPESAPVAAKSWTPSARVRVRDTTSGQILGYPVPRSWLDGRFPNLKEVPSSKAGK